jgi:hypothetical protein
MAPSLTEKTRRGQTTTYAAGARRSKGPLAVRFIHKQAFNTSANLVEIVHPVFMHISVATDP